LRIADLQEILEKVGFGENTASSEHGVKLRQGQQDSHKKGSLAVRWSGAVAERAQGQSPSRGTHHGPTGAARREHSEEWGSRVKRVADHVPS